MAYSKLTTIILTFLFCDNFNKEPYLIYPDDNTEMVVLWQADDDHSTNKVKWGTSEDDVEEYYSLDYGPVHITVIDIEYGKLDKGEKQYDWVEDDLKKSDKPVKIVLIHKPGWSADVCRHSISETTQDLHDDLFKVLGVSLVIAGHNHCYTRTEVDGINHLTLAGAGVSLVSHNNDEDNVVKMSKKNHFARIEVINNKTIRVKIIEDDGDTVDDFSMIARNAEPDAGGVDYGSDDDGIQTCLV